MSDKTVDLPEPDGPTRATSWPGLASKLMPSRASGRALRSGVAHARSGSARRQSHVASQIVASDLDRLLGFDDVGLGVEVGEDPREQGSRRLELDRRLQQPRHREEQP